MEFGRIISPGGMALVTLLDSAFFDQLARASVAVAEGDTTTFLYALATLFPNLEEAPHARFDRGEPVYAGSGGGGVRSSNSTVGPRSLPNSCAASGMPPDSTSSSGCHRASYSLRRWSGCVGGTWVSSGGVCSRASRRYTAPRIWGPWEIEDGLATMPRTDPDVARG